MARAAALLGALVLAGCMAERPAACQDPPGAGITSNAPQDSTLGAKGTSSTSNGIGSTAEPTRPPCR